MSERDTIKKANEFVSEYAIKQAGESFAKTDLVGGMPGVTEENCNTSNKRFK